MHLAKQARESPAKSGAESTITMVKADARSSGWSANLVNTPHKPHKAPVDDGPKRRLKTEGKP